MLSMSRYFPMHFVNRNNYRKNSPFKFKTIHNVAYRVYKVQKTNFLLNQPTKIFDEIVFSLFRLFLLTLSLFLSFYIHTQTRAHTHTHTHTQLVLEDESPPSEKEKKCFFLLLLSLAKETKFLKILFPLFLQLLWSPL